MLALGELAVEPSHPAVALGPFCTLPVPLRGEECKQTQGMAPAGSICLRQGLGGDANWEKGKVSVHEL